MSTIPVPGLNIPLGNPDDPNQPKVVDPPKFMRLGFTEQAEADKKIELGVAFAGITGQTIQVHRSGIEADSDTVECVMIDGRMKYRHLHPQDVPSLMISDPKYRGGYLCPKCGDEVDQQVAKLLSDDIKVDVRKDEIKKQKDADFEAIPLVEIGVGQETEDYETLLFFGQTRDKVEECLKKLGGLGIKFAHHTVTVLDDTLGGLIVPDDLKDCFRVDVYFKDIPAHQVFLNEPKTKDVYMRYHKAGKFLEAEQK